MYPPFDPKSPYWSLFKAPKPGTGRTPVGASRKPPAAEEDAGPLLSPEPPGEDESPAPADKSKDQPKVVLKNLAWGVNKASFNDKVSIRLEADLPASLVHLSRIEIQVIAVTPAGRREPIDRKEVHLKGGKASGEVTVFYPQGRGEDGNLLAACNFVFLAKHRESEAVESPKLPVTQPFVTNVRWEKAEEWFGVPVKLSATTCLKDGEEVTVKVASENGLALETKAKAKRGRLEVIWTPCLCGVAAGEDGKYPERVEYYAVISKGEERAEPERNFFLKTVGRTEYQTFSKDCTWGIYGVHSEFQQRIMNGVVDVQVRKTIMKAWQGYWVNMTRAGISGTVKGCPYDSQRWGRITNSGLAPNQFHDGEKWRSMPAGFIPSDQEFSAVGFIKSGDKFIEGGEPLAVWPEKFKEYDFDKEKYVTKRKDWKKDTDTRWSRKSLIRPKPCRMGMGRGGCGYHLDLDLELERVSSWREHTITVCKGKFRSNSGCFSLEDEDISMAAHEVGHLVGMPDEYEGGAVDSSIDGDGAVQGLDPESIMGDDMDLVKKRHYANFVVVVEGQVEKKVGRKICFLAADE